MDRSHLWNYLSLIGNDYKTRIIRYDPLNFNNTILNIQSEYPDSSKT